MGATASDGTALNGVTISYVNDVTSGNEYVESDDSTITVHIAAGSTTASDVVNLINKAHDAGTISFTAGIDPLDDVNGGQGLVEDGASAMTRDGSGKALDQKSGLQITNGGETFTVSLAGCKTVEDVLNAVNANSGLLAEINSAKDGISIRSRTSGCDFMIGENGGTTAAQLGLRTFTEDTKLSDLNYGTGVKVAGSGSASGGVDFMIALSDGTAMAIDISGATTIGDVIDLINNNANNKGKLTAQLDTYGNGIELVDNSGGTGTLTVANSDSSSAATDLGLIPKGQSKIISDTNTITGRDVNETETKGIFTALINLKQALLNNDTTGIKDAISMLDSSTEQLNLTQADLGVREQNLDAMSSRLTTETTNLKSLLSDNYDADVTQTASDLSAQEVTYQAALKATASILQMTLMNYL
jgi:flagellin-like hook-associated protein FlgL